MTSFGCKDTMASFNPSFRIQGLYYFYSFDNQESEVATRCAFIVDELRPDIVSKINQLLEDDNHYVEIFKVAKEMFEQ